MAPRRRVGGRPASRVRWDRLGRVVLVLVLFGVLISYVNPAVNFVDAWRGSHEERSQLQELTHEKGRLVAKVASMKSAEATTEEARKLGMIVSGERSYVIRNLGR